jgi:hypothetical protein
MSSSLAPHLSSDPQRAELEESSRTLRGSERPDHQGFKFQTNSKPPDEARQLVDLAPRAPPS